MSGEGEFENSLEYTPTWVMAGVCTVMFLISHTVVYIFNHLKDFVVEQQKPIYLALQKVTKALSEELVLTGLISVFLTFLGKYLTKIPVPACVLHWDNMWPCSPADRLKAEAERQANAHPPAHPPTTSSFCSSKVPLLSAEAVHQIHIFVFFLAAVYFILSFISFVFGTITIRCWQKHNTNKTEDDYDRALRSKAANLQRLQDNCMYRIFSIIMALCQSFFKQFIGFVTESDYMVITWGLCMNLNDTAFTDRYHNFHNDMSSSHEDDFNRIVGIRWYLWTSVIVILVLNVHGWHVYFWIALVPLILLIIAGTVLELLVTRRALKISQLYDRRMIRVGLPIPPTDVHASFVLWLIQFILYQNTYQIAIFVWIGITFGFDSCMMEQLYYPVPRLIIGGFILGLCGFSSLPLYTIASKKLPNIAEPAQG